MTSDDGRIATPAARGGLDHRARGRRARSKGRLRLHQEPASWRGDLRDRGLLEIPVDGEIGIRAARLDRLYGDPADRLIVATALGGHRLVTADRNILDWSGALLTHDAGR